MGKIVELKHPGLLAVTGEHGSRTIGGDQYWYPKEGFIPPGACGATTASNVLAYLLRTRPALYSAAMNAGLAEGLGAPVDTDIDGRAAYSEPVASAKAGYLEFMKKVYRFLYPRIGGLMAGDFLAGMTELASEYGLPVKTELLRVPIGRSKRPSFEEAAGCIRDSLEADIPVAFLILSNGCVENLDTWHWVTILALDENKKQVQIVDNGLVLWADLEMWLGTSIMGGSFARISVNSK